MRRSGGEGGRYAISCRLTQINEARRSRYGMFIWRDDWQSRWRDDWQSRWITDKVTWSAGCTPVGSSNWYYALHRRWRADNQYRCSLRMYTGGVLLGAARTWAVYPAARRYGRSVGRPAAICAGCRQSPYYRPARSWCRTIIPDPRSVVSTSGIGR